MRVNGALVLAILWVLMILALRAQV